MSANASMCIDDIYVTIRQIYANCAASIEPELSDEQRMNYLEIICKSITEEFELYLAGVYVFHKKLIYTNYNTIYLIEDLDMFEGKTLRDIAYIIGDNFGEMFYMRECDSYQDNIFINCVSKHLDLLKPGLIDTFKSIVKSEFMYLDGEDLKVHMGSLKLHLLDFINEHKEALKGLLKCLGTTGLVIPDRFAKIRYSGVDYIVCIYSACLPFATEWCFKNIIACSCESSKTVDESVLHYLNSKISVV